MAINDEILEKVSSHLVDLDAFDDDIIGRVVEILNQAERDILAQIQAMELDLTTGSRDRRLARLSALLDQARGTLETAYADAANAADAVLLEAAEAELIFSNETVADALSPLGSLVSVNSVTVAPQLIRRLARDTLIDFGGADGAAVVADWFESQSVEIQSRLTTQLQQGVYHGEGMAQITRRITGTQAKPGVMDISRSWATTLTRTAVTAIVNEARVEVFAANDATLRGVYHVTTLDDRTTLICIVYSGKAWRWAEDGGDPVPIGHDLPYNGGCPRHPRCRSLDNPLLRSWQDMGIAADEIPATLQSRFNGEVPEKLDGDNMLQRASADTQDNVLGKGMAELWRSGRISLRDMVTSTGQPRTLTDVRRRLAQ